MSDAILTGINRLQGDFADLRVAQAKTDERASGALEFRSMAMGKFSTYDADISDLKASDASQASKIDAILANTAAIKDRETMVTVIAKNPRVAAAAFVALLVFILFLSGALHSFSGEALGNKVGINAAKAVAPIEPQIESDGSPALEP
jgi:hypothetical protein